MDLKIPLTLFTAFVMRGADAFVPHSSILRTGTTAPQPAVASKSARFFGVDPNLFHDVAQHTQHLPDIFSSFSLADAVDAADTAGDVANEVVKDNGWFGFLTEPIELLLQLIHSGLSAVGISENSWGVSIIAMTLVIKALTFPLTKTQLESTNKMQVWYLRTCFGYMYVYGGNDATVCVLTSLACLFFDYYRLCNQSSKKLRPNIKVILKS